MRFFATGASSQTATASMFRSAPNLVTDNAGGSTSVTLTHFEVVNTANTGAGSETTPTQIGLDIPALDGPGTSTDIGVRNADTTVNTPTAQDLDSGTLTEVIVPAATILCLDADTGNFDGTADPEISDGVVGQEITLVNCDPDSGGFTIAIEDQATDGSSGFEMTDAVTCTLGPGGNVKLTYLTVSGASNWHQSGPCIPDNAA
jgi:hypothetical protein